VSPRTHLLVSRRRADPRARRYYNIPANISTVVDLLEAKHISWAAYAESMPTDASDAFYADSKNYLDPSAPDYSYYVRKHNPLVIYDSVGKNASRMPFIRNFNDFANDMANATLPQWMFVTPNMVRSARSRWTAC
jgi:phospholipase C